MCQRNETAVVIGIEGEGGTVLFQIVHAGRGAGPLPGLIQCRQKHCRQDRDDRYYNEKFNKSKIFPVKPLCYIVTFKVRHVAS